MITALKTVAEIIRFSKGWKGYGDESVNPGISVSSVLTDMPIQDFIF